MRLKRVKIFGFKTFADKTEFTLEGGLVAVVGPNGCGKSNLVDAILWGLGEGSAKQLRASSGKDVIFSGSSRRKPVGFAEVTLIFDNEDGALPIDSPEVQITRRLTRAGESEYSINRQNCRQRDLFDLLADSGLGRAGYAIVGQKEIDQALAASAEDRRGWVDEAAGVQRYRSRKTEAQRRLTAANGHLQRVQDILNELEAQREPLKAEAEVAIRYKSVLASLREVETGLLIQEIAKSVRETEELDKRIVESLELSRKELERATALEEESRTLGDKISTVETEIDHARQVQQNSLTAAERAESNILLCQERIRSLDELEKSLGEETELSQKRIDDAEREVAQHQLEADAEAERLTEIEQICDGAGGEAKTLRQELEALEAQVKKAREIHAANLKRQAQAAHQRDRTALVQREIQGIDRSLPDLEKSAEESGKAAGDLQAQVRQFAELIGGHDKELTQLRQDEERDAQSVRNALAERAALEGRKRGIEATIETHEGLNQGSRAVLEASERGVLQGRYQAVGEAIEAPKEYALAIETALGGAVNDLIVESDFEAKQAISWLKEHRLGRATFQPISLMRPFEPSFELRQLYSEKAVIGRASELVECDPRHRLVLESLLGRVLIVRDLDEALRLAKTKGWSRMVTLEGEVIHSGGAVTGGHSARQSHGLVQRKADLAELEVELKRLQKVVGEFEQRSAGRSKKQDQLERLVASLKLEMNDAQHEYDEARQFAHTLLAELNEARRSRDKLANELKQLTGGDEQEILAVDLETLDAQRDDLLKRLAARTADSESVEERLREARARRDQALSRLQASVKRLQFAKESNELRDKKRENLEPEREKMRSEQKKFELEKQKAVEARGEVDKRLGELRESRQSLLEKSLGLNDEAKSARANATSMGDVTHQAELNRARADARRSASVQRLFEEYGLTEEDALAQEKMHEVPSDAAILVNRFRRDLKAMGDVNLGAIEAFERLSERFDELDVQQKDILEGIEQVQSSIRELDKLTRDRFLNTFERLQVEFTAMFEKLFAGGVGELRLSDSEDVLDSGVEIDVTLPGKRKQQLQLLSGGERSLCATAFLFALLKVKPSPLVILDEVDAPLDGRNVERFVDLLEEFLSQIQFILITHNPTTIEKAPVWLGVTMQEPGVSMLVTTRVPVPSPQPELVMPV